MLPEGEAEALAARLRELRELGFQGLEVVWPGTFRVERVRAAADAAGLPIHGLRLSDAFDAPLASDDEGLRQRGRERLADALRAAAALGATSLSLVPARITSSVSDARAWNLVRVALLEALPLAQELEVRLALRLGPGDFLASPLEAARFVDELDSPWVGWQLDTAWSTVRSYPWHWAHILGERLVKVDLADYSRAAAEAGLARGFEVELGEGDLVGPTLLDALAHALFAGWVTLEAEGVARDALAARLAKARALLELA
ncbi:MAG: sugar phosphate isomerase/epimerase [Planctomycetes bacterium]|nr:sugar phosphate isomerase/epimerase [Planctomycetota bacterium]